MAQAKDDMNKSKTGRDTEFVEAVEKFIAKFSDIAKGAKRGRAIGIIDGKDWVIEEKNDEIAQLKKEKAELEQKQDKTDDGVEEGKNSG